jgi:succinate dehydrogenase / fumarate reductase cytochrome b subunit
MVFPSNGKIHTSNPHSQEPSMDSKFIAALSGYAKYKGGKGFTAFLLHRITGLGTLLFLTAHILMTSMVYIYAPLYSRLVEAFMWPPVMLAEIVLVFCVIFHGANGLRIAYIDLFKPQLLQEKQSTKAVVTTLIIAIILWLPTAAVMGYNLLKHGFGLFGGE